MRPRPIRKTESARFEGELERLCLNDARAARSGLRLDSCRKSAMFRRNRGINAATIA